MVPELLITMIPIGDDENAGSAAMVTIALIAINVLLFIFEIARPSQDALQSFIQAWGVVPREYAAQKDFVPTIPVPYWSTLLTSMFLHGGWAHLGGNMLYLWIFGDNIERAIGHGRFLVFYLLCGLAAGIAHIVTNLGSIVPTVGASGAISGVLGGYIVMFPHNRVRVMSYSGVVSVPAFLVLGLWIVIQFLNGFGSVATTDETAGVAYVAHIGGFVAGAVLIKLFGFGVRRYAVA
jgi:membrane associated rhomboid family serine protease